MADDIFSVYLQYQYDPGGKNPSKIAGYQTSNNANIIIEKIGKGGFSWL